MTTAISSFEETVHTLADNAQAYHFARELMEKCIEDLPRQPIQSSIGVYFLWDADNNLQYVGQSINIKARIASHLCNFKNRVRFYSYIACPSIDIAKGLEWWFINTKKPPLNSIRQAKNTAWGTIFIQGINTALANFPVREKGKCCKCGVESRSPFTHPCYNCGMAIQGEIE